MAAAFWLGAGRAAMHLWSDEARYLGVGAMLVGGFLTLWKLHGPIGRAIGETLRVARAEREELLRGGHDAVSRVLSKPASRARRKGANS